MGNLNWHSINFIMI